MIGDMHFLPTVTHQNQKLLKKFKMFFMLLDKYSNKQGRPPFEMHCLFCIFLFIAKFGKHFIQRADEMFKSS